MRSIHKVVLKCCCNEMLVIDNKARTGTANTLPRDDDATWSRGFQFLVLRNFHIYISLAWLVSHL
jgi:hypothetical protein